jgi:hypothetical protein
MFKKFIVTFVVLAVAAAFAGTAPTVGGSHRLTLLQPSVVNGVDLKAGEYRLTFTEDKATIVNGKQSVEAPVKVENVDQKFDNTAIRYTDVGGKAKISEIRIGGTKTKLLFN